MLVTVGRVGRPHGVRGEVRVDVRTDAPETRFVEGIQLRTEPASVGPLTVASTRWHGGRLLIRFDGVPDRTGAESLRGVYLLADVDEAESPADPDEYFDHQLVGLAVATTTGAAVGEVAEVLHLPGHDVLVARTPDGREVLVPFVAEIVPDIDLSARRILIDPPTGLLDPAHADEATP